MRPPKGSGWAPAPATRGLPRLPGPQPEPKHTAMQLSGHRTSSVFDRYDIYDLQNLEEATAKLARSRVELEPARATDS